MKDEKFDRANEHFWVIGLHPNMIIGYVELVILSLLNQTLVISVRCSGWLSRKVGNIIDISMHDQVIISTRRYIRMREKEEL